MTRIGVVSDTHIPGYARVLPGEVLDAFEGVDLILHAGDMTVSDVMELLETVAPVKAVCGNMDAFRHEGLLPDRRIVTVEQCRIGLVHGWGERHGLSGRVLDSFRGDHVQAVVFGHTHTALNQVRDGVLLFNPGSPVAGSPQGRNTVGFLTVDGQSVTGEIRAL